MPYVGGSWPGLVASIFGGQVNGIIVLPILLGYAVGYLVLVIATIRVVGNPLLDGGASK